MAAIPHRHRKQVTRLDSMYLAPSNNLFMTSSAPASGFCRRAFMTAHAGTGLLAFISARLRSSCCASWVCAPTAAMPVAAAPTAAVPVAAVPTAAVLLAARSAIVSRACRRGRCPAPKKLSQRLEQQAEQLHSCCIQAVSTVDTACVQSRNVLARNPRSPAGIGPAVRHRVACPPTRSVTANGTANG